jgi:hypothetical protein
MDISHIVDDTISNFILENSSDPCIEYIEDLYKYIPNITNSLEQFLAKIPVDNIYDNLYDISINLSGSGSNLNLEPGKTTKNGGFYWDSHFGEYYTTISYLFTFKNSRSFSAFSNFTTLYGVWEGLETYIPEIYNLQIIWDDNSKTHMNIKKPKYITWYNYVRKNCG